MIAVADTTPLHYLILIQQAAVLPKLYGRIVIPRVYVHPKLLQSLMRRQP